MSAFQKILKVRRHYNKWVADQTLEDYALRFTARKGRHMSISRVGKTALGAASFLALEGLAAAVTLSYGFTNTVLAILAVCLVLFITGLPIAYYSAKHGLDIDLLTRGAGFGYLGSTLTSLIYASFTFIFFAIEAAILASALKALFGIPLPVGYLICAVAVIPIVTHGITAISRFQVGTQNIWLLLQLSAVVVVLWFEFDSLEGWTEFSPGMASTASGDFDIILFGAAVSVFFALFAQIGEQVDYLRFMPEKTPENKGKWWFWLVLAGPGWVFIGLIKMLLGSFLAYLAITQGMGIAEASDPTYMYQRVFQLMTGSPEIALVLAALMVVICQMKINVTNAYAGSIAWSNFFSRLTHSHPGRVVWLVFNVTIALILMELGIYQALEAILGIFAIVAISWLASLSADLLINKPLGFSPPEIEFKRGHLYDINPVGMGSMVISTALGMLSYLGLFGEAARNLCHFVSLFSCFICVPVIGWLTGGRYYIARTSDDLNKFIRLVPAAEPEHKLSIVTCGICENDFEREDMSFCPAYDLPICSLCCSLDVRCLDSCKPKARLSRQVMELLHLMLPRRMVKLVSSRLGKFVALLLVVNLILGALLAVIYRQLDPVTAEETALVIQTFWTLFFTLFIASGVVTWLFLLTHESRVVAQQESNRQTMKLTREIEAHKQTDKELQDAKEVAERANAAKTRYLSGISHELRTPLQSIIGYAQLLRERQQLADEQQRGLDIIHRSGLYLTDLIEGLLDVSKIEAGRLELYRSEVQLPELIEQLSEMFSLQARQKGIGFSCTIADPLPARIVTDEKRLRQILINLLSNAVKYTDQGQVEFEVHYRNQVAEFTIRDTGSGIDKYQMQRIFAPFERIRNEQTAHHQGTGLGLTIVKLLTEIMGGDLQVESEPGRGSCFSISMMLPWVATEQLPVTLEQQIIGYEGYQRTICMVDDDPILRGLLADILKPLSFRIIEAASAEECLELLEQSEPDLFLLDISMPGMNGLQLASIIRQRGLPGRIVMLSADARELNEEREQVYDDYLVKPVGNRQLLERIGEVLALKWISSAQQPEPTAPGKIKETASDEPLPEHPLLEELKSYADLGYSKGVNETLKALERMEVLPTSTLTHLRDLSSGFRFDQLVSYLETQS